MDIPPYFPLPQYRVSKRLHKQGLTEEEARQAATIFRVESEVCLLKIWKKLCPTLSDQAFCRNTDTLSQGQHSLTRRAWLGHLPTHIPHLLCKFSSYPMCLTWHQFLGV